MYQGGGQRSAHLVAVDIAKAVLDVGVHDQLGESKDLPAEMKGVAKPGLLPLLGGEGFHWLQVEVVVQMEVVEVLTMDEKVEHVVALSTDL